MKANWIFRFAIIVLTAMAGSSADSAIRGGQDLVQREVKNSRFEPLANAPARPDIAPIGVLQVLPQNATRYAPTVFNNPEHFSITGLPTGLEIDSLTGEITGSTSEFGDFEATLVASNKAGLSEHRFTIRVSPVWYYVSASSSFSYSYYSEATLVPPGLTNIVAGVADSTTAVLDANGNVHRWYSGEVASPEAQLTNIIGLVHQDWGNVLIWRADGAIFQSNFDAPSPRIAHAPEETAALSACSRSFSPELVSLLWDGSLLLTNSVSRGWAPVSRETLWNEIGYQDSYFVSADLDLPLPEVPWFADLYDPTNVVLMASIPGYPHNQSLLMEDGLFLFYNPYNQQLFRKFEGLPVVAIATVMRTESVGPYLYEHLLLMSDGELYSFLGTEDPLRLIASHVLSVQGGQNVAVVIFEQPSLPRPKLELARAEGQVFTFRVDGPMGYPCRIEASPSVSGPWRSSRILTLKGSPREVTLSSDDDVRFFRLARRH